MKPSHLQEWRASGVSDEIIFANVKSLDGHSALEFLTETAIAKVQKAHSFVGVQAARILQQYKHVESGGWVVTGLDPLNNWESMEWGQFKPDTPRPNEEGKFIKYESPKDVEARAIFLEVPSDPNIWQQAQDDLTTTIYVLEGAKKAGFLLTLGYCAIALPGIWMGIRKDDFGRRHLIPELLPFAQPGRQFVFVFDEDVKESTRRDVIAAQWATAEVLRSHSCECLTVSWSSEEGKGIDDVGVNHGVERVLEILAQPHELPRPLEPGEPYPREYQQFVEHEAEKRRIEEAQQQQSAFNGFTRWLRKQEAKLRGFGKPKIYRETSVQDDVVQVSSHAEGHHLALEKGARLHVNVSRTGSFKSTFYSEIDATFFNEGDRIIAVMPDALNPTVEGFNNFAHVEGRHLGNVETKDGKLRRATVETFNSEKVSPANCDKAAAIALLSERNPINPSYELACLNCKHNWHCGKESGDGFGARHQVSQAFKSPLIRMNYGRLHGQGSEEELLAKSILILDESSNNVEAVKTIAITHQDLRDKYVQVADYETSDPFLQSLKFLLKYLLSDEWRDVEGANRFYGINQQKLEPKLKELIPEKINWLMLQEVEGNEEDELKAFGISGKKESLTNTECRRLKKLQGMRWLSRDEQAILDRLESLTKRNKQQWQELQYYRSLALTYQLEKERDELQRRHDANKHDFLSPDQLRTKAAFLPKRWLRDFFLVAIRAINGHIHWGPQGITLTLPNEQHTSAVQKARITILSDASELRSKAALSKEYGIPEEEIFIFEVKPPKGADVEIVHVTGLGKLGKNRGEGLEQCKQALVAKLKELDPTHATFDWKDRNADGVLFRDTVGSNAYKGCKSISTVIPRPNINALLAQYCVLNKTVVDIEDEGFQEYYKAQIREALTQWRGRLREQLRPGEKLIAYVMGDDDLPIACDRTIAAVDITPGAARKGERTVRSIVEVAKWVLQQGQRLTQSALARATAAQGLNKGKGFTQQYLSKIWSRILKCLQLFFSNIYKKSCSHAPPNLEKVEAAIPILEEIAQINEVEAFDEVIFWLSPAEWAISLEQVSGQTRNLILKCWLSFLPTEYLKESIAT